MTEFNWATATPVERRAHWVTALRSGKYEQTRASLRVGESFCCLGVLCDIAAKGRWNEPDGTFAYFGTDFDTHPPDDILEEVGLTETEASALAELNDSGESFNYIAADIEQRFGTAEAA